MRLNCLIYYVGSHEYVFFYDEEIESPVTLMRVFNQYADDPEMEFDNQDAEMCSEILLGQIEESLDG